MLNENILIHRLQLKDPLAFGMLFDNCAPALYGLILRLRPESSETEQVLYDCFLQVHKNLHNYNPVHSTIFSLVLRICLHECKQTLGVTDKEIRCAILNSPKVAVKFPTKPN